mmetsp:Transcript_108559/g.302729  ORF Transcript_108559/g.302729 Transcript_108559/m.302729 type:complete len:247 (-) Transcript_108559:13-753(-)
MVRLPPWIHTMTGSSRYSLLGAYTSRKWQSSLPSQFAVPLACTQAVPSPALRVASRLAPSLVTSNFGFSKRRALAYRSSKKVRKGPRSRPVTLAPLGNRTSVCPPMGSWSSVGSAKGCHFSPRAGQWGGAVACQGTAAGRRPPSTGSSRSWAAARPSEPPGGNSWCPTAAAAARSALAPWRRGLPEAAVAVAPRPLLPRRPWEVPAAGGLAAGGSGSSPWAASSANSNSKTGTATSRWLPIAPTGC